VAEDAVGPEEAEGTGGTAGAIGGGQ